MNVIRGQTTMHIAVYACTDLPMRYVLSRDCTLPSGESDQLFGELRPCGTVRIEDDLMDALTPSLAGLSGCTAYLVEDPWSARYITALLERSN